MKYRVYKSIYSSGYPDELFNSLVEGYFSGDKFVAKGFEKYFINVGSVKKTSTFKRPNENWKKTINKRKFNRCIKECVNLVDGMYYNPNTNCFYAKDWCNDDSEAFFKHSLSKVPESKLKFKEDVLTIYNEYLDEEMKRAALQSCHSKEGDSELFEDLKESLEECVEIKKERDNSWTDKHYDFKYQLTKKDLEVYKKSK